jgi:hypothetical protein
MFGEERKTKKLSRDEYFVAGFQPLPNGDNDLST